jgi:hypothetical protein
MADFDAQLPVRTIATEFTTEVANAAGTTINPAEDYAQASTTSGQNGVLIQGATTTAAPTYTTGTTNPLSLDTSGNLRVTIDASTSLQNVNVTQWDSVVLGSPSAYGTSPGAVEVIGVNAFVTNTVAISASSLPLPTGAATSANQTTEIGYLSTIASESLAQGSATSGQLGNLVMGAATTATPTYTTGDTYPLSLTTTGFLRVQDSADGSPTGGTAGTTSTLAGGIYNSTAPTLTTGQQASLQLTSAGALLVSSTTSAITQTFTYVDNAAVASGSSVSQSVAGPINLDQVMVSASGEVKILIAIGVTGSEVTKLVAFTSAANKNFLFTFEDTYVIPSGSDVKVTITNRDTAAMDIYSTIVNH